MAKEVTKVVKAGRPENCKGSDIDSIKKRACHEMAKFDAKLVNKMEKLYTMLEKIAFAEGEFKDASIQCRKTAIQDLIARGEVYTSNEAVLQNMVDEVPKEDLPVEEGQKQVSGGDVVVKGTLEEKREAFRALQAAKKKEQAKT